MRQQKRKKRQTRKQAEQYRRVSAVLRTLCWLASFCIIVSLIKIATVFATKGDDVAYVSDLSLVYVRVGIAIHAVLALLAILSRDHLLMVATIVLTIVMFVATFSIPIYAETTECTAATNQPCKYSLIYSGHNIYDF